MKTKAHKRVGFSAAVLFCLGLIAVLLFATMGNTALVANAASATNPYLLSQMAEEECIEFIVDSGVEIPTDFENSAELGSIVKDMIVAVESNPEYEFVYSYNVTLDFAENIRIAVNDYYGVQGVPQGQSSIMAAAAYTLQDSTFVSNSGYMSYNCYAYSIGRDENPPQYSTLKQYQPGDFSRTSFSMNLSISQMASVVQKDLEALGFVGVSLTTSQPSVQTGEKLICMRKGSSDYHFMRYDGGSWYHKPGFTSILKYKYQPTNSRVWIGEYVDMSGNAYLSSTTYTNDIYFIKYSESLFTTTVSNNTVTITGVKRGVTLSGSVEIPSSINGQAVVAIGNSAFANQTQMSQITIPASVTKIGERAFSGTGIQEIVIPANVVNIEKSTFEDCYDLNTVTFEPDNKLRSIGNKAFASCYSLNDILIPKNVFKIDDNAFMNCRDLNNIAFEQDSLLRVIGTSAFLDCILLEKISLPAMVEYFYEDAFKNTKLWSNVAIDNIVYVDDWIVGYKGNPTDSLTLDDETRGIAENAFPYFPIETISIPSKVEYINEGAFRTCDALNTIIFHGITKLHQKSFSLMSKRVVSLIGTAGHYANYLGEFFSAIGHYEEYLMTKEDYNYPQQYHFTELTQEHTINDLKVTTKRLRVGYIEKEYIVASPRRAEAGVAYLEYKPSRSINQINVDLALWSASELLRASDCTAVLQYKTHASGEWITRLDLLNDIKLTTDRKNPIKYVIVFPIPATEFRFYLTAPKIGTSNNTGRLCIGNIEIYTQFSIYVGYKPLHYHHASNYSIGTPYNEHYHQIECEEKGCGTLILKHHIWESFYNPLRFRCIYCGYVYYGPNPPICADDEQYH